MGRGRPIGRSAFAMHHLERVRAVWTCNRCETINEDEARRCPVCLLDRDENRALASEASARTAAVCPATRVEGGRRGARPSAPGKAAARTPSGIAATTPPPIPLRTATGETASPPERPRRPKSRILTALNLLAVPAALLLLYAAFQWKLPVRQGEFPEGTGGIEAEHSSPLTATTPESTDDALAGEDAAQDGALTQTPLSDELAVVPMATPQLGTTAYTLGVMNDTVYWVQTQLQTLGYIPEDSDRNGCLDESTQVLVRRVQRSQGFTETGAVDQSAVNAILSMQREAKRVTRPILTGGFYDDLPLLPPEGLQPGAQGQAVLWLTRCLDALGYSPGTPGLILTERALSAVHAFQLDQGLALSDAVHMRALCLMAEVYVRQGKPWSALGGQMHYRERAALVQAVNRERAAQGYPLLRVSLEAMEAAQVRAYELAGLFSAERPDGSGSFTALTEQGLTNVHASCAFVRNQSGVSAADLALAREATRIGCGYYASGTDTYQFVFLYCAGATTAETDALGGA